MAYAVAYAVAYATVAQAAVDSGVARKPYPSHYPLKTIDDVYGG